MTPACSKYLLLPFFLLVFLTLGFTENRPSQTALTIKENAENTNKGQVDVEIDNLESREPFIPSKNWQQIKPGQSIPAGLHVRINLQTGLKEAKFLDKDGDKVSGYNTKESISEALKLIKPEEIKQLVKDEKAKFRSMDELKRDFEKMKIKVKSDSEILQDLVKLYPLALDAEKVEILQNLEYIVHQYDVAQDFVKMGALDLLIPDLNSTNAKIRSLIAFTLGSAMQGNPKVQIACLEKSVLSHLLRLVSFDPDMKVRNRAMFAISCMVRQFPLAQHHLLRNGGFSAFAQLFRDSGWDLENQKLQMKVINLIQDLITEQTMAGKYSKSSDVNDEKIKQYNRLNLGAVLVQNGFCKTVPKFLYLPDIDTQEKVVSAMLALVDYCGNEFNKNLIQLKQLGISVKEKALLEEIEDDDDYFKQLYGNMQTLIRKVEFKPIEEL